MKTNNYVFANSGLQVNFMKVAEDVETSIQDAVQNRNSTYKAIFLNNFKEKDGGLGSTIWGQYYYQIRGEVGTFSVYRKEPGQKFYEHICELSKDFVFVDYNIVDNAFYHYLVAFKTDATDFYTVYQNTLPDGSEDYVRTSWDGWSITDIVETQDEKVYGQVGDVWTIRYNLTAGDLTSNTSVTAWETLGKYPKFSVGKQHYKSSEVTCLVGDIVRHNQTKYVANPDGTISEVSTNVCGYTEKVNVESKYSREVEKYIAWDKFINDGELKLLKDNKGHSWIIQVQAGPTASIDYNSNLQQTTVSFTWQEAMSTDDVSIISASVLNTDLLAQ